MRKHRFVDMSTCICNECGLKMPIPREHGNLRKKKHIKDIWCPRCKKETKFTEIRKGDYLVDNNGNVIY